MSEIEDDLKRALASLQGEAARNEEMATRAKTCAHTSTVKLKTTFGSMADVCMACGAVREVAR